MADIHGEWQSSRNGLSLMHSSPGRFFAALQLKVLVAYIVSHYDFEPLEIRPLNMSIGAHIVPPQSATVRVRRRKGR